MSNLTRFQQQEVGEITAEAYQKCPIDYRDQLQKYFYHLAEKAVQEGSDRYLDTIQSMLNLARAKNEYALTMMVERFDAEIQTLRQETAEAFNRFGVEVDSLNHRVSHLENTPQRKTNINVNVNFDQFGHAICWLVVGVLAIATVGTLLNIPLGTSQQPRTEVNSHE